MGEVAGIVGGPLFIGVEVVGICVVSMLKTVVLAVGSRARACSLWLSLQRCLAASSMVVEVELGVADDQDKTEKEKL